MPTKTRLQKLTRAADQRQAGLIVVLEDIHDPHNAAAILRSCDGFGVQDVYYIFDQEKYYNPNKVGRVSSSSANKWITITIFKSSKDCFKKLKRQGYTTIGTALDKRSVDIYATEMKQSKIALIVGNEHRGLSDYVLENSDMLLTLPMAGLVQSLNVSVTTAVCLYEITRQRRAQPRRFKLTPVQKKRLVNKWVKK